MKIERSFTPCADRYEFDFGRCSYANGWAQVDTDQDAAWFGTWCNPETFELLQYAEGDVVHTRCEDAIEFASEIDDFCAAYDARIDPGLGEAMRVRFVKLGMAHLLH